MESTQPAPAALRSSGARRKAGEQRSSSEPRSPPAPTREARTQLFGARPPAASRAPPFSEGGAEPAARNPRRPGNPRLLGGQASQSATPAQTGPPRRPGEQRRPGRPAQRPLRRADGRPAGPGDPHLGAGPRREALAPPKRPALGQTAAGTAAYSSEQAARRQRHPRKDQKPKGASSDPPVETPGSQQRTLCWLKALRSRTSKTPLPGPRACVGDQKGQARGITARRHRPR